MPLLVSTGAALNIFEIFFFLVARIVKFGLYII